MRSDTVVAACSIESPVPSSGRPARPDGRTCGGRRSAGCSPARCASPSRRSRCCSASASSAGTYVLTDTLDASFRGVFDGPWPASTSSCARAPPAMTTTTIAHPRRSVRAGARTSTGSRRRVGSSRGTRSSSEGRRRRSRTAARRRSASLVGGAGRGGPTRRPDDGRPRARRPRGRDGRRHRARHGFASATRSTCSGRARSRASRSSGIFSVRDRCDGPRSRSPRSISRPRSGSRRARAARRRQRHDRARRGTASSLTARAGARSRLRGATSRARSPPTAADITEFLDSPHRAVARVRRDRPRRRCLHHLQHVHDPRRAADPRARPAARDGRERPAGDRRGRSSRPRSSASSRRWWGSPRRRRSPGCCSRSCRASGSTCPRRRS